MSEKIKELFCTIIGRKLEGTTVSEIRKIVGRNEMDEFKAHVPLSDMDNKIEQDLYLELDFQSY